MVLMTMKYIIIAILSTLLIGGCADTQIKHLPPEKFVEKAKQIEVPNSSCWTDYVGCSRNRAYLEYGDVLTLDSNHLTIVYWTELDGLPKELADKLRAGNPPWKPWY